MASSDGFKVGVYVDGFNLYYGGRSIFGKGTQGWKWLDLRKLSRRLLEHQSNWPPATEIRIVYCTARVSGVDNPQKEHDQNTYIRAIRANGSVDHVEFGYYLQKISKSFLATKSFNKKPHFLTAQSPIEVVNEKSELILNSKFLVTTFRREEKGSDVNVGSHLLIDALLNRIDGAIVISNDSDLKFPIEFARNLMPIGTINPSRRSSSGALQKTNSVNRDSHFWYQLKHQDYLDCQLENNILGIRKPPDW